MKRKAAIFYDGATWVDPREIRIWLRRDIKYLVIVIRGHSPVLLQCGVATIGPMFVFVACCLHFDHWWLVHALLDMAVDGQIVNGYCLIVMGTSLHPSIHQLLASESLTLDGLLVPPGFVGLAFLSPAVLMEPSFQVLVTSCEYYAVHFVNASASHVDVCASASASCASDVSVCMSDCLKGIALPACAPHVDACALVSGARRPSCACNAALCRLSAPLGLEWQLEILALYLLYAGHWLPLWLKASTHLEPGGGHGSCLGLGGRAVDGTDLAQADSCRQGRSGANGDLGESSYQAYHHLAASASVEGSAGQTHGKSPSS
eukprot:3666162-Amphidinium_carterae.1